MSKHPNPLILGSASPWRRQLMSEAGYQFECLSPDIDERAIRDPNPRLLVRHLAQAKAKALLPRIDRASLLITSDQVVWCNEHICEKPLNITEARNYLQCYNQHAATTITAVTITQTHTGLSYTQVDEATVEFHDFNPADIEALVHQPNTYQCAGGFQVESAQGISPHVKTIEGDITSVKGLPMALLATLLHKLKF